MRKLEKLVVLDETNGASMLGRKLRIFCDFHNVPYFSEIKHINNYIKNVK